MFSEHRPVLCSLAHLDAERLQIVDAVETKPAKALTVVEGGVEVYLPLAGLIDLDAESARLLKPGGFLVMFETDEWFESTTEMFSDYGSVLFHRLRLPRGLSGTVFNPLAPKTSPWTYAIG